MTITEKHYPSRHQRPGAAASASGYRYIEVIQPVPEDLERVARNLSLDASEIDQLQDPSVAPGVVEYPDQLLVRFSIPRFSGRSGLSWDRVDLILGSSLLVAVYPHRLPVLRTLQERSKAGWEPDSPTRLMGQMLLNAVEAFHQTSEGFGQVLQALIEQPAAPSGPQRANAEFHEQLSAFHRGLDEFQDVLSELGGLGDRIDPSAAGDIRAAHDRLTAIADEIDQIGRRLTEEERVAGSPEPRALGAESPEIVATAAVVGERRLQRITVAHAFTALIGGLAVSFGAVSMSLTAGPWQPFLSPEQATFLGALAFPIGFVILLVGKGELFTENFFVPVTGVMKGRGSIRDLLQLWGYTLFFNIVGAVIFAALVSQPGILTDSSGRFLIDYAVEKVHYPFWTAVVKAVFAGWLMTMLTWLILAAEGLGSRLAIIWMIGFLIVAGHFNHVVISAAEIFMAMGLGAPISLIDWLLGNFVPALIGNLVGGVIFVTLLGYIQAHTLRRSEERQRVAERGRRNERV